MGDNLPSVFVSTLFDEKNVLSSGGNYEVPPPPPPPPPPSSPPPRNCCVEETGSLRIQLGFGGETKRGWEGRKKKLKRQ